MIVGSLSVILVLYLGTLFLFLALGMWIGVSVGIVGIASLALLVKGTGINLFILTSYNLLRSFTLTALPLFIFMGEILMQTKLGNRIFSGLRGLVGPIPGGLLHVNVWSCSILAAICGSSTATVAAMATVAVPELERQGYNRRWLLGSLTVSGTLGLMIPPSLALIIYGFLTETSVVHLFTAGIVPGLVLAGMFSGIIIFHEVIHPGATGGIKAKIPLKEVVKKLIELTPVFGLIALVLGTIYAGIATPTEAAGIGCIGSIIIAGVYREVSISRLFQAIRGTVILTSVIGFIMIGALAMTYSVSHLGMGNMIVNYINEAELSPYAVIFALYAIYILLGCVMDPTALLLIIVPVSFPIVMGLGFDPLWFGIVVVVGQELACVTPPIGVNLWVMQGVSGMQMGELTRGALPFILVVAIFLVLLTFVPQLATWLPALIL